MSLQDQIFREAAPRIFVFELVSKKHLIEKMRGHNAEAKPSPWSAPDLTERSEKP